MGDPNHQIHYQQLIPHNGTHNQQVNAQSDVASLSSLEMTTSESYMNMGGSFMEYNSVVAAHANSSQSNIVFSQNMNNSSSAVVVTAPGGAGGHSTGAEVDILQAALHLADISEEELKAEELHTSLYPMQESHDMLPSLVVNENLTNTNGRQESQLVNSYTAEGQNHLVIATTDECNAQILSQSSGVNQNLMSLNVNDSQVMISQQRPTVVMSAQIQPSFQPPPPQTAKSNSRKRKASSSNQSSASPPNGPTTPRPRGRPKSPKGQPKNTPKKKPQPFISTYNGQKVMYIPVPCPPNGETPEMGATSDVLPPSVLSAAAQSLALNGNNSNAAVHVKEAPILDSPTGHEQPANCYPNGCSAIMSSDAHIPRSVPTAPSQLQMSPCVEVKSGPAIVSCSGILPNGDGCKMTMNSNCNMPLSSLPKITSIPAQQPPINSAINGPDVTNRTPSFLSSHQVATAAKIQQQHPQLIQLATPCSQSTGVPVQSIVAAGATSAPNITKVFPPSTQDGGAKKIAIPSISHSTDTTAPIKVQIAPVVQQTVSHTLLQPVGVSLVSSSSGNNSTPHPQHHSSNNLTDVNCGLPTKREAHQGAPVCNGIRIQPNVNVSTTPMQHQPGSQNVNNGNKQQQQMLTFHIVQNPKTGAIEFIPVGNSGGKGMTQIQIIPKPIVPKAEDLSKPQTLGGKLASVKVNGKTEPKSKSAANTSKKQNSNSTQSVTGKVQGRKRGRPPTRTNSEIDAKHKEAVGRVTAALNSIGAIVSPVPCTQVNTIKKITPLPQTGNVNMNSPNVPVSNGSAMTNKPAIILNFDPKNSNGGAATLKVGTAVGSSGLNALAPNTSKAVKTADGPTKNGASGTNTHQQKASSKTSKTDESSSTGTAKSRRNTNDSSQSQSKKKGGGSNGSSTGGGNKEPTPKAVPVPAHIQAAINYEQNRVLAPDYSRCFENMRDATMRLLPYHVIQDMAYDEHFLKKEDEKFEIKAEKLLDRTWHLFHRFKCAMLKDSLKEAPISDFALLSRLSMQSETQDLEALKQQQLDQLNTLPLTCPSSLNQPPPHPSPSAAIEMDPSCTHFNSHPSQPTNYPCANTGLPITNLKPAEFKTSQQLHERGICNNMENSSFTLPGTNPSQELSTDATPNAQVFGNAPTFTDVQESRLGPPLNVGNLYHSSEAGFPSQKIMNKLEPMDSLEYSVESNFSTNVLQSNQVSNEDSQFINTIMQMKCEISDCDQVQQQQNLVAMTTTGIASSTTICSPSNTLALSAPFISSSSTNYSSAELPQQSILPHNELSCSSSSSQGKKSTQKTQKLVNAVVHTNQALSTSPLTQSEAEQAVNSILL